MSNNEKVANDLLIEKSINYLPFTLAFPIKQLFDHIASKEYGKAMNYALDFIEISTQYISILLLVRLIQIEKQLPAKQRHSAKIVNKIDKKRQLSLGDWINDILTPLLLASKERISEDRLIQSLTTHLLRKQSCTLLGDKHEPSVVQIRNEYRGHGTTLSENIYRDVIYTLEPRILILLHAVEPMQQYHFYSSPTEGKYMSHKGVTARIENITTNDILVGHYYIAHDSDTIDLYPLIICNDKGYIYLFQTLKEECVSYISSNENAVTLNDDSYNDAFDSLLQQVVPHFDISKDLNWEQMTTLAKTESEQFLMRIYSEKKYNRELFVDRKQMSEALKLFFQSPATLFPMLGDAGQGKTNQLCFWTERLIEEKKCVLIFSSADFTSSTLDIRMKNIFGFSHRKNISHIIDNLHEKARQNNQYIYIFFDAINECLHYKDNHEQMGVEALYKAIEHIFINEKYSHFKVVITCRSYTWKHTLNRIVKKDSPYTFTSDNNQLSTIRGFTADELEQAYSLYQELHQMSTPFHLLTSTAKIRLQDPLILKIACTNYLSKTMPKFSKDYTSIALFNHMYNDIYSSYAGKKQCQIIELIATHLLNEYEHGVASDSINENELKKAITDPNNSLYKLAKLIYKHDGISVAYTELINKPERPVLRSVKNKESGEKQIQFIYERFLEYVMARVFVTRESANNTITTPIPPQAYIRHLSHSASNVVYMGAMRNALAIDILRTHNYATIISMLRDYADNYEVSLLVNELNSTLIAENYEQEIFTLIDLLLSANIENGSMLTTELNAITQIIEKNKATDEIIKRHKVVQSTLLPLIRMRKSATISTLNGIFASDYFNESLYTLDPYKLLWRLLDEPIVEVRNDAVMYIYYLSVRNHTIDNNPLKENIAEKIVNRMFCNIRNQFLITSITLPRRRNRLFNLLETSIRLTVLMIIDTLLSKQENSRNRAASLVDHIRSIFNYITGNLTLVRAIMPFLQLVLRKQFTFQSAYVNNIIEYQGFWNDSIVPKCAPPNKWSRQAMCRLLSIIPYHSLNNNEQTKICKLFESYNATIIDGYTTGDSLSYFVLERIMIIMGVADWSNVREIVLYTFKRCKSSQWSDYTTMSLLYSLYQIAVYSPFNRELLDIYGREAKDWTLKTKGLFLARNSHKANTVGLYKRNVMNWYAVVYCTHSGDGRPLDGDDHCVPLFFSMIDSAIEKNDKLLLFHLIENISELITDFGYIHTALNLLLHILNAYDTNEKVELLDNINVNRDGIYTLSLVSLIGNTLSTAKNYFSEEVDRFIKHYIAGLSFPGISKYREQILSYSPSGESLSDLFTHKFGNFLMWSLLHEPAVQKFAIEAMMSAEQSKDCFDWFSKVIKILIKDMFNKKI